jgi:hypothetical protein
MKNDFFRFSFITSSSDYQILNNSIRKNWEFISIKGAKILAFQIAFIAWKWPDRCRGINFSPRQKIMRGNIIF